MSGLTLKFEGLLAARRSKDKSSADTPFPLFTGSDDAQMFLENKTRAIFVPILQSQAVN